MRTLLKIDSKDGVSITFLRPFSDEEYEALTGPMRIESFHRTNVQMRDIVRTNGQELEDFILDIKNNRESYKQKDHQLLIEANRLLLNFLSSFTTFIDHCKRQYSIHLDVLKEEFEQRDRKYFDQYFEYRFFKQMRNIISHIAFPLSKTRLDKEGFHIIMVKKELLKFDWKRVVSRDIETFEEEIDVLPMIQNLCEQVKWLSFDIMYDYKEKIIEAFEAYQKVATEVQGEFGFSEAGSFEELRRLEKPRIQPFSISQIHKAIQDLNEHPRIKIRITHQSE
ncbi:hypothetical protein M662_07585 [Bacillus sp. SB49]|uniref:hypothetical protein n=1 Tax=Bacillus sp. SB49 TaxID=1071080 RepID=UPI0003F5D1E6|nr:hypothetical protein [Bacillus sp. SB49]QHT46361.1 hypothetical protein M662_07585 [Bacillus sp. SB49]